MVAREIEALRSQPRTGAAADLSDYLGYPLDRSINGELSAFRTQAEIFAQLQAVWLTKDGKQKLRTFLPKTARFMEAANEHAKNEIRKGNTLNRSETSSSTRTDAGKSDFSGSNQETTRTENSEKGLASRGFSLNNSGNDYLQRAQI